MFNAKANKEFGVKAKNKQLAKDQGKKLTFDQWKKDNPKGTIPQWSAWLKTQK